MNQQLSQQSQFNASDVASGSRSATPHQVGNQKPSNLVNSHGPTVVTNDPHNTTFGHPTRQGPIIKRIPKSARKPCALLLSTLVNDVLCNIGSAEKWNNLFAFAPRVLLKPKRGGKKRNLARLIIDRVTRWPNAPPDSDKPALSSRTNRQHLSNDEVRARAVMAKIEDGNLRAAVRIICSDDAPAPDSLETLNALKAKHPCAPADCHVSSLVAGEQAPSLTVDEESVKRAIISFPAGSSCGPDCTVPSTPQGSDRN